MSKVLITGGAGFIGSALAERFALAGHEVTVLDNLSPQIHGMDGKNTPSVLKTRSFTELVVGDITDKAALESVVPNQDIIVHLAAETGTGQSMYQVDHYSQVNVGGTALLLQVLAELDASRPSRLVVASSRSIYGEGRYFSEELGFVYPGPRSEADLAAGKFEPTVPGDRSGLKLVATTEDSKIHPSSVYGITKHTQESLVMTVAPTLDIVPVALRYQNVYGPGQSLTNPYTGILSIFSNRILAGGDINIFEDGRESRDFVFVDDVVEATYLAAVSHLKEGVVLNVGSGVATSVAGVVSELMQAFDREVPVYVSGNFRTGDIRHNVADLDLVREKLGYRPSVSFAEGLREFAAWVASQELKASEYESSLQELRARRLLK